MKRMWLGGALLAVVLAAGLLAGAVLEKEFSPGADQLRRAEAAAMAGNWTQAAALTADVREHWDSSRGLVQILNSHDELDRIEILFAQLEACQGRDRITYGTLCAALAEELESLSKAHSLTWENLF